MSQVHQQYTVGFNSKPFEQGVARMDSAARNGTKSIMGKLGQIGMQGSDIGVQMQAGTRATTIMLQQGTQIAQMFGPKAAIATGITAMAVAMWDVARGAKAAKEESELLKQVIASNRTVAQGNDQADIAEARAEHGDEYADSLKRSLEYEQKIADINLAMKKGEMNASQGKEAKAAEDRTLAAEKLLKLRTAERKEWDEIAKSATETAKLQKDTADMGLTPQEKMSRLASEMGELAPAAFGNGDAKTQQLAREKWEQKRNELAKTGRDLSQDNIEAEKKASQDAASAQKLRLKGFEEINRQMDKMKSTEADLLEKADAIAEAEAKAGRERAYARGEATLDEAEDIRRSPEERRAGRTEARAHRSSVRRAAARKVEDEDKIIDPDSGNVIGRRGMTAADRAKRQREIIGEAGDAKNKNKIEAEITDSATEKLTKAFAAEIAKLIAK